MKDLIEELPCENMLADCENLLRIERLSTQSEIRHKLMALGYSNVNQSTVSRMLARLHIVKVTDACGKKIYQLPSQEQKICTDIFPSTKIIFITHNTNVVVIKTQPGCAQLLARLLDLNPNPNCLGAVAGNDMVMVAPKSIHQIEQCEESIRQSLNFTTN